MGDPDRKPTGLDPALLFGPEPSEPPSLPSQPSLPRVTPVSPPSAGRLPAVPAGGRAGGAGSSPRAPGAEEPSEPRSLADLLGGIAGPDPLPGMDASARVRLRAGAAALLRGGPVTVERLASAEDIDALAAASTALQLRGDAMFEFWKPLLKLCKEARTSAPVADLVALRGEGRALRTALARLAGNEEAGRLDGVVRALIDRAGESLPTDEAKAAARAAEEARPAVAAPRAAPPQRTAEPEAAKPRVRLVPLLIVLVASIVASVLMRTSPQPEGPALLLPQVQAALPDAVTARFYRDTLELEVGPAWRERSRGIREGEVRALYAIPDRPPFARVGVRDRGGWIMAIEADNSVHWLDEAAQP